MKLLAVGGFAAMTAALLYVFVDQKPADVYDMPVAQAYGLLAKVQYEPLNEAAAAAEVERSTTGNGVDKVIWATRGSHSASSCDLLLKPFEGDPNRTHVTVTCAGGSASDGAAAGMVHNLRRNNVIERVDATLTGRPFDLARAGSTASRWPGDGVDGSLGTAMGNALEMDREMHAMQAELEQDAASEPSSDEYAAWAAE